MSSGEPPATEYCTAHAASPVQPSARPHGGCPAGKSAPPSGTAATRRSIASKPQSADVALVGLRQAAEWTGGLPCVLIVRGLFAATGPSRGRPGGGAYAEHESLPRARVPRREAHRARRRVARPKALSRSVMRSSSAWLRGGAGERCRGRDWRPGGLRDRAGDCPRAGGGAAHDATFPHGGRGGGLPRGGRAGRSPSTAAAGRAPRRRRRWRCVEPPASNW